MKNFFFLYCLVFMISGCVTSLHDEKESTSELEGLENLARCGDAVALNTLGEMYHFGRGVSQDFSKAFDFYKRAVDKGNAGAANHLGRMYTNGEGVQQSSSEAVKWYKKSVELDPSDFNVCINGLHKNRAFASLLILAAFYDIPAAQFEVGQIYQDGAYSVSVNPREAIKWYIKAAKGNYPHACILLYHSYRDGAPLYGIEKDEKEAQKWLEKAKSLNVGPLDLKS